MRKGILILVLFVSSITNAQQKNVVKANPLGLILGSYSIGYEREIAEKQSIQVDLNSTDIDISGISVSGGSAGLSYRRYFQDKDAFEGWYISPGLAYGSLEFGVEGASDGTVTYNGAEVTFDGDTLDTKIFAFTFFGGYQWNWNSFTLELAGGPILANVSFEDDLGESVSASGIDFSGSFSIGYAF